MAFLLLLLLFVATVWDIRWGKVPNILIAIGFVIGVIRITALEGCQGILLHIPSVVVPVILLFPLYCIGVLGAGDIKLFSMMGCFCNLKGMFFYVCFSFLIGAVISLFLLLWQKNFISRMTYFFSYLFQCISTRHVHFYYSDSFTEGNSLEEKKSSVLYFTIPILLSFLLREVF